MRYHYYQWIQGRWVTVDYEEFMYAFMHRDWYDREYYIDDCGNTVLNLVSKTTGVIIYKRKGEFILCPTNL